ncbi:MAG: energy-coupling factor transporter transmembrane component T [archaeon]
MFDSKADKTIFRRIGIGWRTAFVVIMMVAVFAIPWPPILLALALFSFFLLSLVDIRRAARLLILVLVIAAIPMILLAIFLRPDAEVYIRFLARIGAVLALTSWYVTITDLYSLLRLLMRLRLPFQFSLSIYLVLRFLPEIQREYMLVRDAQRLQGVEWSWRGWASIKESMQTFLLPLFSLMLNRAGELSVALYLREKDGSLEYMIRGSQKARKG